MHLVEEVDEQTPTATNSEFQTKTLTKSAHMAGAFQSDSAATASDNFSRGISAGGTAGFVQQDERRKLA